MKSSVVNAYGFGLVENGLVDNFAEILYTQMMTKGRAIHYKEFCERNKISTNSNDSFKKYANECCADEEAQVMCCIVNIFNEKYNLGANGLEYENVFVYYANRVPEDEKEKNSILTKEQIRKMVKNFFGPLISESYPKFLTKCDDIDVEY